MSYSATDTDHPMIIFLGWPCQFRTGDRGSYVWHAGRLANVHVNGTATVTDSNDIVIGVPSLKDLRLLDKAGEPFTIDELLGPWRVTRCCGASYKGMADGVGCRSCYRLIDDVMDGPAEIGDKRWQVAAITLYKAVSALDDTDFDSILYLASAAGWDGVVERVRVIRTAGRAVADLMK